MTKLHILPELTCGFGSSPFGECCVAFSKNEIYSLTFPESHETAFSDLKYRFPQTIFLRDDNKAQEIIRIIFEMNEKIALNPQGTDFQQLVWKALQQIPKGKTTTYKKIAEAIGKPKAVRAVGTAIGANPIAFLIPCHRVIRTDGGLGGFRWGLDCKKRMLEWEKK